MKCEKQMLRLYAVTDRSWVGERTLLQQVEEALRGGVTCVQIREKTLGEEDFYREALKMKQLCDRYGVPLIVNDNVELAIRLHAAGVHVGQGDMQAAKVRQLAGESLIVGVSARTVEQAVKAQEEGADYLGVGAVFGTTTKTDARAIPRETLEAICRAVTIPVVAIGGISRENLPELKGSGAAGVALVSAIFAAPDIEGQCRELRALADQILV